MMETHRYRWPAALALLVGLGLAVAFWPRAVPVEMAPITRGAMTVTVDDDGITRIREVYTVTAPLAGRILRIEKHSGDEVKAGDTVAVILPTPPEFLNLRTRQGLEAAVLAAGDALNAAKAQVDSAEATLDYAQAEEKRNGNLFRIGAVSRERLEQSQHDLRRAQAALASARAVLRQRESELAQAKAAVVMPDKAQTAGSMENAVAIPAPGDGKVLTVYHESEAPVAAGSPILDVGDPHRLEIAADMLSREALKVSPGDAVFIENWGGSAPLNGRVRLVEPQGATKVSSLGIEEQRVNVIIDLTDPPGKWERLGHGFQVDVRIAVWHGDAVTRVPVGALFRHGDNWAVFRDENGLARLRDIKLGHMASRDAEVLDGLREGDKVILYPGDRIRDGVRIREAEERKP